MSLRPSGRKINELRNIEIQIEINKYAEGSCLIYCGDTQIICTATFEDRVPAFVKGTGEGWITAEYNMIPRSTDKRIQRDREKVNSRALEIQRLIGRSLRSAVDLTKLKEKQLIIDCDVIQADGGTRCASITGGFVAMYLAIQKLLKDRVIKENPIKNFINAVSCGYYKNTCVLDLDYEEDSNCDFDINFVMNDTADIVEIQGTAEGSILPFEKIQELYLLAKSGGEILLQKQKEILGLL